MIVILMSISLGISIGRYLNFSRCNSHKSIKLRTAPPTRGEQHRDSSSRGRDPNYDACDPRNFLVLIMAGARAEYQKRRSRWRESTCPASYAASNVTYRFILAMPAHEMIDPNGHNQANRASVEEISDMAKLRDEYRDHGDVVILSLKDVYSENALKMLRGIEWAAERGMTSDTSIVVKHDDEYCLRPEVLGGICRKTNLSNSSLYAGNYLWSNASYESQKGLDGSFAPYFSGWLYALSSDLVQDIAHDPNSVLTAMNVGYMEDLQMGWWVKNQADMADSVRKIDYVMEPSLLWEIEGGVEKSKSADSRGGRRV
jgi:hypothetical protein